MKAEEIEFVKFLNDNRTNKLLIPIYQRAYEWTTGKEVSQLWEDINNIELNKDISTHFLNSIVYIKDESIKDSINIIDGQQRITTISLLFIAIRDSLKNLQKDSKKLSLSENDLADIKIEIEKISENFLERKWQKFENRIRLSLSNKNNDFNIYKNLLFRDILNKTRVDDISKNKFIDKHNVFLKGKKSNLISTYDYFQSKPLLKNYSFLELKELLEKLEKVMIVQVTLELGKDSPQIIFSSLNGGGLKLKDTDLIKNSLFMKVEDRAKQEELHSELWEKLEIMPFKKSSSSDKVFAVFLQHFFTMQLGRVVTSGNLYDEFNRYVKSIKKENSYETVKSILTEMLIFKDIFLELQNRELFQDSILQHFGIEAYYPFLMKLKFAQSPFVTKISKIIESYYLRRFICSLPAGATKNVFAQACKEIPVDENIEKSFNNLLKTKEKKPRFPSQSEFQDSLKNRPLYQDSPKFLKATLFAIELSVNPEFDVDFDDLTVEHILPQDEFKNLLPVWRENFSLDEYENLVHTIGNCTLLIREENSSIGSSSFISKKPIYSHTGFYLNEKVSEFDNWTKDSISGYADEVIKLALKRWENL